MNTRPHQFTPYRIFLEKAKTPEFRALAERLIQTTDEFRRLENEFPKSIAANRAKRRKVESPAMLTTRQKEFISEADRDAVKASEDLDKTYRSIGHERELVEMALNLETFDFKTWNWLYDSVHEDDKPMANQIRQLQSKLIADMTEFLAVAKRDHKTMSP